VTNTESWDRVAERAVPGRDTDAVNYGPAGPTERELRLLGDVNGRRVLDLGCGVGQAAVALARQGATAIAVDASNGMLEQARRLAERHEVRVEWHHGDLADLAFLRADSIDLVFSAFAVAEIGDVDRLFRQVHRVLHPNRAFVFSYEHPLALSGEGSYFGDEPVRVEREGEPVLLHQRSVGDVFSALGRAGFRVDALVEPRPTDGGPVPSTIVWRARKEGV
jgi:SAM-dependent methyltransferase